MSKNARDTSRAHVISNLDIYNYMATVLLVLLAHEMPSRDLREAESFNFSDSSVKSS